MADKDKTLEESEGSVKETKKYLFKMTSSDGETEKHWTISSGLLKFGVFSMVLGALLLIGTLGFTIWAALNFRLNQTAVTDMERSTELQQEQLLSLSKKANKLSEQLQNLTQMESELRIQAGVAPLEKKAEEVPPTDQPIDQPTDQSTEQPTDQPTDQPIEEPPVETVSDEYDGQGGPIDDLNVESVEEALKMLESGIVERRGSLVQLQDELKRQREQIAQIVQQRSTMAAAPMTTITMPGSSVPYTNAPTMNNSFALGITDAASNVPAIWPTTGVVTSPYGLRWGGTDFHPGIDIANDMTA